MESLIGSATVGAANASTGSLRARSDSVQPTNHVNLFVGGGFGQAMPPSLKDALKVVAACTNPSKTFKIMLFPGVHDLPADSAIDTKCSVEITNALSTDWDLRNTFVRSTSAESVWSLCAPSLRLHHLCFDGNIQIRNCLSVSVEHCLFYGTSLDIRGCLNVTLLENQISGLNLDSTKIRTGSQVNITKSVLLGADTCIKGAQATFRSCSVQEMKATVQSLIVVQTHFGEEISRQQMIPRSDDGSIPTSEPSRGTGPVVEIVGCESGKFSENVVDGGGTRDGVCLSTSLSFILNNIHQCVCGLAVQDGFRGEITHNNITRNVCGMRLPTSATAVVQMNRVVLNGYSSAKHEECHDESVYQKFEASCGILVVAPQNESATGSATTDTATTNTNTPVSRERRDTQRYSLVISSNVVSRNDCGLVLVCKASGAQVRHAIIRGACLHCLRSSFLLL